jgi:hypothetical protein
LDLKTKAYQMKTTTGKGVLIITAVVLGLARVALLPAIIVWVVTAGTVLAVEQLLRTNNRLKK